MSLAFSFPSGRDLKPLPLHFSLSKLPVGLFSRPLPLFPCSPDFLAPHFWGSPNYRWLHP